MKKIIVFILSLTILLSFSSSVLAQIAITNPLSSKTFAELLTKISTGIAGLVAVLSGIMIIIAGMMYLTSAGDQQKMNTAKTALKYAIMGIVVALLAIPIVEVIKEVLGVTTTPTP